MQTKLLTSPVTRMSLGELPMVITISMALVSLLSGQQRGNWIYASGFAGIGAAIVALLSSAACKLTRLLAHKPINRRCR